LVAVGSHTTGKVFHELCTGILRMTPKRQAVTLAATMRYRSIRLCSLALVITGLASAEWQMTWQSTSGETVHAEVCPLKYGKSWAYAIEIDDGPKWVRSFAAPFFATYTWTDAPPGVSGGTLRPLVGGVAVIVAAVGTNSTAVNWEDLAALRQAGWGVLNHSWRHDGSTWGGPEAVLSDQRVIEDAWWGQTILAHGLDDRRCPTAAVYANGYTDYNRNGALADVGIRMATRVGGSGPARIDVDAAQWMDMQRNYLDDGAWLGNGGDPLHGIPGLPGDGPQPGTLLIDFTHSIDQDANSDNHQRWATRLQTITERWGAQGTDALWCAPSGEICDYVHAARAAIVQTKKGTLTVTLPDDLPGSALTVRLTGISDTTKLEAPRGGTLYRQGNTAWITTPMIGLAGAAAPKPTVTCIYDGPAAQATIPAGTKVAGAIIDCFGDMPAGQSATITLLTATGDVTLNGPNHKGGWIVGSVLFPIVPTAQPIVAKGIRIEARPEVKRVRIFSVP
jgi:hypothetical protein